MKKVETESKAIEAARLGAINCRVQRIHDGMGGLDRVFNLIDITGEEVYQSHGLFAQKGKAIGIATSGNMPCGYYPDEVCVIEIRERIFGKLDQTHGGETVFTCTWRQVYDEDRDEYKWEIWETSK